MLTHIFPSEDDGDNNEHQRGAKNRPEEPNPEYPRRPGSKPTGRKGLPLKVLVRKGIRLGAGAQRAAYGAGLRLWCAHIFRWRFAQHDRRAGG